MWLRNQLNSTHLAHFTCSNQEVRAGSENRASIVPREHNTQGVVNRPVGCRKCAANTGAEMIGNRRKTQMSFFTPPTIQVNGKWNAYPAQRLALGVVLSVFPLSCLFDHIIGSRTVQVFDGVREATVKSKAADFPFAQLGTSRSAGRDKSPKWAPCSLCEFKFALLQRNCSESRRRLWRLVTMPCDIQVNW